MDLKQMVKEPFSLMFQGSTMRDLIDPIFKQAGYEPKVLMESSFNYFLRDLTARNMCATIIPQSYATDHEHLVWFSLPGKPRFEFDAVYMKGYRPSAVLREFVTLAAEYAAQHFQFPIF